MATSPHCCCFSVSDTLQSRTGLSHICVVVQIWRGGAGASPPVALDKTVGQKRKWKCHVNVLVMQRDHVVEDRGCLWFMLCQSKSLSNNKMAVLGFMPLLDYYLENMSLHVWWST